MIVSVLGKKLDYNFDDPHKAANYEKAARDMIQRITEAGKAQTAEALQSDVLIETCAAVHDAVKAIFGDEAEPAVFGEGWSLKDSIDAAKDIVIGMNLGLSAVADDARAQAKAFSESVKK